MFRLRHAPAALSIAALGVFNILFMMGRVPYAAINAVLLAAAPVVYLYSSAVALGVIALAWIFLFPLFVYSYHVDPTSAAATIAVFNGVMLVCLVFKGVMKEEDAARVSSLAKKASARDALKAGIAQAGMNESVIREREAAIISLYEITKKMSGGLRFDDIFTVFSAFLKDNFVFRDCGLLMLKDEADKDGSDREYSLRHGSAPADAERPGGTQARPDFQKLVRMFSEGFRGIYVARAENPQFFGDLGIADAQVETFVAVPILSEKKMVGILTMDNLSKDDVERLAILVMQFALEIKKVRLYEAVERMAITDSLTGLYVRRHFRERMDDEVRRSKKHKFSFAFIMLDIDGFKRCNDMYGHLVGDVVLRDVTRIMRENVREIDILGRYGGEELAVILPETNAQSAMIVGERLRSKIAGHVFQAYDEKLTITVSAGISVYPRDASDSGPLIEKADAALYAAKKSGKNVVCEYKKEYNNIS